MAGNLDKFVLEAEKAIGHDHVTTNLALRQSYLARSVMGIRAGIAEALVKPGNVKEVQAIVKLCNKYKIPISPYSGGLSGGYAQPLNNKGIILDLVRMNHILEVDVDSRYVVVEPGVTSGQVWAYFRKEYPEWAPPVPDGAPPRATLIGDAMERGFSLVTSKYGPQGRMVNGLEVVLPRGDIIYTGSWAMKGLKPFYPWGPGPDFTGLFLGAQGTMGIITKAAIRIIPHPPFIELVAYDYDTPEDMTNHTLAVLKKEVGVMVQGGNWWLVPSRKDEREIPTTLEAWRKEKYYVPAWMMNFELWAHTEKEMESQKDIIAEEAENEKKAGSSIKPWELHPAAKAVRLTKPNLIAVPYAMHRAGFVFITWYLPFNDTAEFCHICEDTMEKHDLPPVIWVASIEQGRQAIVMPIVCFDSRTEAGYKQVEAWDRETTDIFHKKGWMNYRPNAFIHWPAMRPMMPEYVKLLKEQKSIWDPNGIMHPGRLQV
ncbi:MAG: FAD-binding oxidoreductase [Promethearchaeota archaeon]